MAPTVLVSRRDMLQVSEVLVEQDRTRLWLAEMAEMAVPLLPEQAVAVVLHLALMEVRAALVQMVFAFRSAAEFPSPATCHSA